MPKLLLLCGLMLGLFVGSAHAQAAGRYNVTPTGGSPIQIDLNLTDLGDPLVFYDGILQSGATWNFNGDAVEIFDGDGHAILEGGKNAPSGASGRLLDGNTGPPPQQAGTWSRP
ncbi:MAG: hypothetical protein AAF354_04080 [Pseudomonadota bacterium]